MPETDLLPETDLHISERLRKLLPPLTPEEKKQLRENIERDDQVNETIYFWNDGKRNVVIDGMHRWDIVRGTKIPYDTSEMHFSSYEQAEIWILDNQLGRRNLTNPAAIRKIRGELYNRLKRPDKGHGDQTPQNERPGDQFDPPPTTAAQKIAEKTGVSAATVKRDGARVAALENLTKAAKVVAERAPDRDVKTLSKLSEADQDAVARAVRTGQSSSVGTAIKQSGFRPPGKAGRTAKPPVKLTNKQWFQQYDSAIGPVVRIVNKIANELGGKDGTYHVQTRTHLEQATKQMMAWLGVQK